MIYTNNNKITANSSIYKNTSWLSLTHNQSSFPASLGGFPRQIMYFLFSEPTSVTISWGNGTKDTYNTRLTTEGHVFDIDIGTGSDPNAVVKTRKYYGNTLVKNIRFIYDRNLLVELYFRAILLGVNQNLVFSFSEHNNLKSFHAENIKLINNIETITDGAILQLNLNSIGEANIEEFTAIQMFSTSNEFYTKVPLELFSLPLKALRLSGNHQYNLATSNIDLIGTLGLLEELYLRIPFTQAQGFPIDVTLLKNTLKSLSFPVMQTAFNWTSLPTNISELELLESLNLDLNGKTSGGYTFSIGSSFFSAMPNFKSINLGHTVRYITNWDWISSLPDNFEHAILTGNNNQTRLDDSIIACFEWVKGNNLLNKTFEFQTRLNTTSGSNNANIPTGTYQEPIDHDNPASPLEAIWVLVNDYNCTVTYRA